MCATNQIVAVNDKGQLVGACSSPSDGSKYFYINQNGLAAGLDSLMPADFRLVINKVFSLNEQGQILAWGTDSDGLFNTVLLTPIKASCDANQDGKVDITDLSIVYSANHTVNAAYDIDGDGVVSVRDIRKCVIQCTKPYCSS